MTEKPKCRLCKTVDAVKIRSHIVPQQLLEEMLNEEEKKGRDAEISIAIGNKKVETYFGSRVSLEKIQEIKGRDLTDEEIEQQQHHHIKTYFFCKRCEDRFGRIETYYDAKNNNKIRRSDLALVFWLGVLWRMSEVGNYGFSFTPEQQEMIRTTLDKIMGDTLEETISNIEANAELLSNYSYILIHCPDLGQGNKSFTYGETNNNTLYKVLISDFCLYFNVSSQQQNSKEDLIFCGFERKYDSQMINIASANNELRITVTSDFYNSNMKTAADLLAKRLVLDPTEKTIKKLFRHAVGFDIPEKIFIPTFGESVEKMMAQYGCFNDIVIPEILAKNCKAYYGF